MFELASARQSPSRAQRCIELDRLPRNGFKEAPADENVGRAERRLGQWASRSWKQGKTTRIFAPSLGVHDDAHASVLWRSTRDAAKTARQPHLPSKRTPTERRLR